MASVLLRTKLLSMSPKIVLGSFSTSSVRRIDDIQKELGRKEAPRVTKDVTISTDESLKNYITVEATTDLSPVSGVPEEHVKGRLVRIYEPPKNAMQSGTDNIGHWELDFDTRQRWENPLMGWCSTGDPVSNMKIQFNDKEEAIRYCEQNGYKWYVQQSSLDKEFKPKSYGVNFAWNKRTRVSTK